MLYNQVMKKIMLIYPPGEVYQRGEDRCQINVEASVSNSLRACNDLGYAAAVLKQELYSVFLKDYSSEKMSLNDLKEDMQKRNPDVIFMSTTNGTVFNDLKTIKEIKKLKNDIIIILKGALFFNPDFDLFDELDFSSVDYLIGGETEFIILPLINAHYNNKSELAHIQGICYKDGDIWKVNKVNHFFEDLDSIPFPDRSIMKNDLYINPLTNKPMATVATSRGCSSSCIYCISPVISGKKVRFRSVESVYNEIEECIEKYGITDFFFKSDTFTINRDWVINLCDLIINSQTDIKINWVANSRVNTLDEELLKKMKQAGCSLIALGIESGNDESLLKMKKGITVKQSINAINLIKKIGIQTYGFYLIGFPWETKKHLKDTENLIFKLDTDFMEISVATPFKGSELYRMVFSDIDNGKNVLGKDSFKYTTIGTKYISHHELESFRKKVILKYHLRPSFIFKKIFNKNLTPALFFNYVKFGLRMIKNVF